MTHALKAYRQKNGITLEDFAVLCGASVASISRIENGKQTPSMRLLSRIVRASGGDLMPEEFMYEAIWPEGVGGND